VKEAYASSASGKGDLTAALRTLLRREQEIQSGNPYRLVPSGTLWPTAEEWRDAGFVDVFEYDDGHLQVHVRPWHPHWLDPAPPGETIESPLFGEVRRRQMFPAAADPFLLRFASNYLSAGQREAVRAVLTAPPASTLAVVLPTGAGKSLCAHLPALLDDSPQPGLVLVIVPTIALALDQQERLRPFISHPTAYIGGAAQKAINLEIRRRIRAGEQRILFTSPESVLQSLASCLYEATGKGLLKTLVIDEAHMVENWGDDFRSAFQELAAIRVELLRHAGEHLFRTLLLTATLPESTLDSLQTLFGSPGPFAIVASAQLRPEPAYWAAPCDSEIEKQARVLEALRYLPRPLILYTTYVNDAWQWWTHLRALGYLRTGLITGRTQQRDREQALAMWNHDALDIVVATSAFGLGVDKDDVRAVVHACVPENLDRYYQEVGRGGRDGTASVSLVIYTANDVERSFKKIISVNLGIERWRAMFRRCEDLGDSRYRVPVDVAPDYRPDSYNEYNVAWNLRTLTLMARAGLIQLDAEPPPTYPDFEGVPEEQIDFAFSIKLEDYRNHRVVRILEENHYEETVWRVRVENLRQRSYAAQQRSFELMNQLLAARGCVSEPLAEMYAIPARGERRGVAVAYSCGGCRDCRTNRRAPFEQQSSVPWPAWEIRPTLGEMLRVELGTKNLLAIFHGGLGSTSDIRKLDSLILWLAQQGVRNIIAPEDLLGSLRERFREFTTPLFFYDQYDQFHTQQFATVVASRSALETETLRKLLHESDVPRVLILPEYTVDPFSTHRRLCDIADCRTYRMNEFLARVVA
jgi:superfamily II DNA or RNA helicase